MNAKTIDPETVAKIERNMKFVRALLAELDAIEVDADHLEISTRPTLANGMRKATERIRKVMDAHVE